MNDIILILPCPLCQPARLITSMWEPQNGPSRVDLPYLVSVAGCLHADAALSEYNGEPVHVPVAFWRALQHEIEMWALDRYTDALESRMDHSRSLRGEP